MQQKADSSKTKQHAAALIGLLLIALLYAWPLLSQLTSAIPGKPELADVTEYVWSVGWIKTALTTEATLLSTDKMFVPFGADLRLNTFGLLQGLVAFPLTPFFGVIGAYNLVLIATLILNGTVTYALFYWKVRNITAAFVSAALFLLGQSMLSQINVGRSALGAIWLVSGALLLLISLIDKPYIWKGAALGLILLLALLTDFQIILFCAIWLSMYTLYQMINRKQSFFQSTRIVSLLAAILIFLVPFLIIYLPTLTGAQTNGYRIPGYNAMLTYSFQLKNYAAPNLWWAVAGSYPYAIATIAALFLLRHKGEHRFWLIAVFIFMILALGPYLQPTRVPMPFAFFGLWKPFRQFRTPARLMLPAMIGFGMIAAYLFAYLLQFIHSKYLASTIAIILIGFQFLFAQNKTPLNIQQYPTYNIYNQIASEKDEFTILEVPFSIRSGLQRFGWGGEVVQYYQHIHHKDLLSGSMARLPTAYFDYYKQFPSLQFLTAGDEPTINKRELEKDFLSVIDWSNSKYVLVHGSLLNEDGLRRIESFLDNMPQMSRVGVEKDLIIYRIKD